ncbi:STAS domain-containing protein [Microbulbifer bruguierae]|uniref:STAS domain-containing protein n=1 Tax=Microbulbifer bruguierae TaxID=3029061 RepID=A0ABY8NC56_9GAMM|nr:STAS domain-containing protein [Microbulbifer bruguierae]WGL16378.1 STAS domain-containing protein [Microbulbifer bruguierae]
MFEVTMQSGQIMVGDHQGIYVVKLVGDVRLNLCTSFDKFIDKMFSHGDFRGVVFDLYQAKGIDSTTLGLMAKIAMRVKERGVSKPLVLCDNAGLRHLLDKMGFDALMDITGDADNDAYQAEPAPLKCNTPDEHTAREMVLEAHRVLMSMNEQNEATFRDLVQALEVEQAALGGKSVLAR